MSDLQKNLAALASRRQDSKKRRSGILDTIIEISQDRAAKMANATPAGSEYQPPSSGAGAPVGGLPAGHFPGDGHNHSVGGKFDPNFQTNLDRLLNDFKGKVSVSSGYRSPERQAVLWQDALRKYGSAAAARKWVAPPGKSNHGRGLAADLKFSDAATRRLIHQSAGNYGLHFPLSNENWHIEPISARKKK